MEHVIIGKIVSSFKVDGAIKIISTTSFPAARFKKGETIMVGEEKTNYQIIDSNINHDVIIISVKGIHNKEEADLLKGNFVYAYKDESLLEKNQYYYSDIVGCKVINQDNIDIGIVLSVEEFPAQLTLRIKGDKKEHIFIPYISQFIKDVDIKNKIIKVETIEGMI